MQYSNGAQSAAISAHWRARLSCPTVGRASIWDICAAPKRRNNQADWRVRRFLKNADDLTNRQWHFSVKSRAALCAVNIKEALFNCLKTLRPSDKRRFFYRAAAPSANEEHISGSCITEMNLFPFSQEPFSAGLRIADEVAHQTVARGSLLRSWITALHAPRGAVIGGGGGGWGTAQMQKKWIPLDPRCWAKQNPWVSAASYRSLPPICKTKRRREKKKRAFRLSSEQMPPGARGLRRAVFAVLSHAASAYNSSRAK